MPFTPVHVLAIIPLAIWKRLPFSALAIGSMAPDLPMFLDVVDYAQTHSAQGAITTCWPIGLATFMVFQCYLKEPLFDLFPSSIRMRCGSIREARISNKLSFWFWVSVAIIIGVYSHQVWDAFTHKGRWGTELVPMLNWEFELFGKQLAGYKLFQYGSTSIGLPLMAALGVRWVMRSAVDKKIPNRILSARFTKWSLAILGLLVLVAIACSLLLYPWPAKAIVKSVTNSMVVCLAWWFVIAGLFHWRTFKAA